MIKLLIHRRGKQRIYLSPIALVTFVVVLGGVSVPSALSVSAQPSGSRPPILHFAGGKLAPVELTGANLIRLLPNGKVVPDLATYSVSRDHLTYTFTIRHTARFSNGHPVTAQDAAYTLTRNLTPSLNSYWLPYLGLIRGAAAVSAGKTRTLSGVSVLNSRTLRIRLTISVGYFLSAFSLAAFVFDRNVVAGKFWGTPNDGFQTAFQYTTCTADQGPGPFMFVCHDGSSNPHSFYSGNSPTFTLVPNPYYYGRKPHVRPEYRYFGEGNADYSAYLAHKVDLVSGIPEPYIDRWRGKSTEFRQFPTTLIQYITPNVHLAPFDNLHCRLAAAYAIDRKPLMNKVMGGLGRPVYAIIPKGMLGYYPGNDNPHYDLKRARAELAQCPGRTTPVDLTYPDTLAQSRTAGDFIVRGLAAAGFNIKLKLVTNDDWFRIASSSLDLSKTQLFRNGWYPDYPDPQDFCNILLRSGQPNNIGGWRNGTYDRLVDQADRLLNRKMRAALYIRAQHIALNQGAFISLSNQLGFALIKPYVHGMVVGVANSILVPKNNDWANVTVSAH